MSQNYKSTLTNDILWRCWLSFITLIKNTSINNEYIKINNNFSYNAILDTVWLKVSLRTWTLPCWHVPVVHWYRWVVPGSVSSATIRWLQTGWWPTQHPSSLWAAPDRDDVLSRSVQRNVFYDAFLQWPNEGFELSTPGGRNNYEVRSPLPKVVTSRGSDDNSPIFRLRHWLLVHLSNFIKLTFVVVSHIIGCFVPFAPGGGGNCLRLPPYLLHCILIFTKLTIRTHNEDTPNSSRDTAF